jgi:two-component system sensor histidine kinase MprB
MSLRARLTLGTIGTLALAICAGLAVAYLVVRGELRGEIDSALRGMARPMVALRHDAPARPVGPKHHQLRNLRVGSSTLGGPVGYIQLVDRSGHVSRPSGERSRLPTTGARAVATGRRSPFFGDATVDGVHVRIYTTRLNGRTAVEIARPLSEVDHALARIRLLFVFAALAAIAGAAALGTAVARAALRPVDRLTEHAERIAESGNLAERTNERRSDELGRLAHAFNTMLDALSRSVSAQRQLVADASHELRTPLASARANLDLVELHEHLSVQERQRLVAESAAELREMTHLIDGLVELARADAATPEKQPVRLDYLTEQVVAAAARRTGTHFRTELAPTLVNAAPAAVTRAVANLVDNAVKWSPTDAAIDVTVSDGAVTVRDRGPGIDAADLPHIFDRFYRAAAARSLPGSGLGLAIVQQVAQAHGGTVSAEPASGGTLFTLRLPVLETAAGEETDNRPPGLTHGEPSRRGWRRTLGSLQH